MAFSKRTSLSDDPAILELVAAVDRLKAAMSGSWASKRSSTNSGNWEGRLVTPIAMSGATGSQDRAGKLPLMLSSIIVSP